MSSEGFKETEIGLIPEDWKIKIAEKFCLRVADGTHDSPKKKDHGMYLITSRHLKGNKLDFQNAYLISEQDYDEVNKRSKVNQWDVLISMIGTIGEIYLENNKEINYAIKNIGLFKSKNRNQGEWLYYYLKSFRAKEYIHMNKSGTTQEYITLGALRKFPIVYPKDDLELKKIISILSSLDRKIELNNKMNQNLEAIGQAIFRHWFVHFEFPNSEGQPYRSSGGEMVDSELGEIPKGWDVQEIGNTIETTGGGTPSTKKEEYWENGDIQWFSPRDITANKQMFITDSEKKITKKGLKNSSAKLFPPYSLMMTSRATVGELSINTQEASTNQGFITCIPNEKLSTYYLHFWIKMNKENIISLSSGSTFREINKSTFRALKIVIPNNEVLSTYNSLLKSIFSQIEILQAQNQELSQIRASLLPKLMSGKIRVNIPEEATVK